MAAKANKAIQDMTSEEAMATLPKLREEAAVANARVTKLWSEWPKPPNYPPTSTSTGTTCR